MSHSGGRFIQFLVTICTTETIVEGQGMYVAIIVENDNPRIAAIKEEFEMVSVALTNGQK